MKQDSKIKVVFVLPSLVAGGAERVISFISQNIDKEKFESILLIAGSSNETAYDIRNVEVKYLNKSRVLHAIPYILLFLVNKKPNIVLSSISHLNTVMGLFSPFFINTKFIGREANVLSLKKHFITKKRFLNKLPLIKIAYKNLDIILCQSIDMYNDMKLNYNIPSRKLRIINNPITDGFKPKSENYNNDGIVKFITVASLKKQKGHERIIYAIAKLKFPYQYTIIGDGPERNNIFELINKLGIRDNIVHIPYTKEVSMYLAQNNLFLQGSYVEGFPNCLIESCSVGTPIIAYRAPGGLNEIIEHGVNGYIADNDEEFVKYLFKAITAKKWNSKIIIDSVNIKFNKDIILKKYEELFIDILK
tara:strand:+ start:8788 stop:9873 length:1086 start_codon:yes stop_codon:yes gene_type:complete